MKILAVDFDGTIVEHEYPEIGKAVPLAVETLRALIDAGHGIILWTMRSGDTLDEAVEWLDMRNIKLVGVNENPRQKDWTASPKAYAHRYVDDAAVGCPLIPSAKMGNRPMVDWASVRRQLTKEGWI